MGTAARLLSQPKLNIRPLSKGAQYHAAKSLRKVTSGSALDCLRLFRDHILCCQQRDKVPVPDFAVWVSCMVGDVAQEVRISFLSFPTLSVPTLVMLPFL